MAKKKIATIIPYEHFEWGKTKRVWVDKEDMHPDPSKLLLWGYDDCGETVKGDYKRSFTRKGKTVRIPYSITHVYTASDEKKQKVQAIRKYLRSSGNCER
jgi:hypothetical protein